MIWYIKLLCGEDDGKTRVKIPFIAIAFIRHIVYLSAMEAR